LSDREAWRCTYLLFILDRDLSLRAYTYLRRLLADY
jgi:hypothetical protein